MGVVLQVQQSVLRVIEDTPLDAQFSLGGAADGGLSGGPVLHRETGTDVTNRDCLYVTCTNYTVRNISVHFNPLLWIFLNSNTSCHCSTDSWFFFHSYWLIDLDVSSWVYVSLKKSVDVYSDGVIKKNYFSIFDHWEEKTYFRNIWLLQLLQYFPEEIQKN